MLSVASYLYNEKSRKWEVRLWLDGQDVGYREFDNKFQLKEFKNSLEGSFYNLWIDVLESCN